MAYSRGLLCSCDRDGEKAPLASSLSRFRYRRGTDLMTVEGGGNLEEY